jgi:hypothetical protein
VLGVAKLATLTMRVISGMNSRWASSLSNEAAQIVGQVVEAVDPGQFVAVGVDQGDAVVGAVIGKARTGTTPACVSPSEPVNSSLPKALRRN